MSVFSVKEERVSLEDKGFEKRGGGLKQLQLIMPLCPCLSNFP